MTLLALPVSAAPRARLARAWPLVAIALLVGAAVLAPVIAPAAPDAIDLAARRLPPSLAHWFGTDELGRDLFSRILYGARVSLAIGLLSAAIAGILGVAVGAVSGWVGGWVDDLLMRATDAMLAVPRLPLLMIGAAILQPTIPGLVAIVGFAGWMETARIVRAELLSLRTREFVEAARAAGASDVRVLVRHLLPGIVPSALVSTTLAVGRGILLESALSFFGVGVQPPAASWGNMLYQAQTTMSTEPWLAIFPGLMIFVTVLVINLLGERVLER